ncbi:hypothetical protein BDN70DRAFT_553789 [Pholiota conissans]|uniref:F-box domain-containing protein n=1 Tax=Pholiota conissans TaxID=109636 RepID=A0A9P5Z6U0_9AGAR|nr:hypothetical protein BDN70DRAFT_553789 [Pholiota conissans]
MLQEDVLRCPKLENRYSCIPCEELASIDRQISEAETLLAALRAKRRTICNQRNRTHDPVTSELPVEIVSQIFTNILPIDVDRRYTIPTKHQNRTQSRSQSEGILTTPVVLGAVCTSWRTISWSISQLWATISIDISCFYKNYIDLLREWLSRSGERPLYILITKSDYRENIYDPSIFDIICQYRHRWFYLDLGFTFPPAALAYACQNIGHAVMLDTLKIRANTSNYVLNLNNVCNLRSLYMTSLDPSQLRNANYRQLTRVEGDIPSIDAFFLLFLQAPFLTHCTFSIREGSIQESHKTRTIIQHTHLIFLDITSYRTKTTEVALSRIQFPALIHLSSPWFDVGFVLDIIQRSSCKLASLKIDYKIDSLKDEVRLNEFLARIPSLELLQISGLPSRHPIDFLFTKLSATAVNQIIFNEAQLLPNLRKLFIRSFRWSWAYVLGLIFEHSSNMSAAIHAEKSTGDYAHVRPLHSLHLDLWDGDRATDHFRIEPFIARKLYTTIEQSRIEVKIRIFNYRGESTVLPLKKYLQECFRINESESDDPQDGLVI